MKLTIGSDPELFLQNKSGSIVSSHTAGVPGEKGKPFALDVGAVHRDNVLMELNVPPATTLDEWVQSHTQCLSYALQQMEDEYSHSPVASCFMDEDEMWHPEALSFGCEPDYNAWNEGKRNASINVRDVGTLRSAGGHIHVGFEGCTDQRRMAVVRSMDLFLGVPSLLMDPDNMRRKLYGGAGAYRPKSYGVEYRTLSNFWIMSTDYMAWAYRNTERAVAELASDERARQAINLHDVALAEQLVEEYKLEVV